MFCSFPFLTRIKYFESKLDNIETSDLYISSVRKNHSDSFQHVQYFFLRHVSVRPDPDLQHKRIYGEYCQNIAAGHFCVLAVFVICIFWTFLCHVIIRGHRRGCGGLLGMRPWSRQPLHHDCPHQKEPQFLQI